MSEIILESMSRAVGYGGWGVVMMGVLVVMVGMMAGVSSRRYRSVHTSLPLLTM